MSRVGKALIRTTRPTGAAGVVYPSFMLVDTIAQNSSGASTHSTWNFVRTIPEGTGYLLIPIAVTFNNSSTGISISSVTIGASGCTTLVQFVENDEDFIATMIVGLVSPPTGEQTITITYAENNARRSVAGVYTVADYASIGAGVLSVPTTPSATVSAAITPTASPSKIFGIAAQKSDEGDPVTPLSGVTVLDESQMVGSLGMTVLIGEMTAPDDTELTFGGTFSSATRESSVALIEVAS